VKPSVEENELLAHKIVWMYFPSLGKDEDVYQHALIGLWKATNAYDPSYGTEFSTYATYKIRGEVMGYLKRQERRGGPPTVSMDESIPSTLGSDDGGLPYKNILSDLAPDPAEIASLYADAKRALAKAPSKMRQAKILDVLGYEQKQIASMVGKSQAQVSRYLNARLEVVS